MSQRHVKIEVEGFIQKGGACSATAFHTKKICKVFGVSFSKGAFETSGEYEAAAKNKVTSFLRAAKISQPLLRVVS